jgi:predicted TIM-barrel fold metal-dependent hydrolase
MPRYTGPVVDVDVHHVWRDSDEVVSYLPKRWRDYAGSGIIAQRRLMPVRQSEIVGGVGGRLMASFGEDGSRGTSYDMLREQLLDRYRYSHCVLTHDVGQYGNQLNSYFGVAVCQAVNDWNLDHWVGRDDRFYSVVIVPAGAPSEAAKEIRRVGAHPRIVGVVLAGNVLGVPFGDPIYHPIYEACVEMGLQLSFHFGTCDMPGTMTKVVGGPQGQLNLSLGLMGQQAMHYISSFIVNGVFEHYPALRVLVIEYGVAWLPYLMWRLDEHYELLKLESPYVKRWPSEYIRTHVRLGTQPLEVSRRSRDLIHLLECVDGVEDLLCFASDWPHNSTDDPEYIGRVLPSSWHEKVFARNASDFYGFAAAQG